VRADAKRLLGTSLSEREKCTLNQYQLWAMKASMGGGSSIAFKHVTHIEELKKMCMKKEHTKAISATIGKRDDCA
jgi:hypothetical protein